MLHDQKTGRKQLVKMKCHPWISRSCLTLLLAGFFWSGEAAMPSASAREAPTQVEETVSAEKIDAVFAERFFSLFALRFMLLWTFFSLLCLTLSLWGLSKLLAPNRGSLSNALRATLALIYAGPIFMYLGVLVIAVSFSLIMAIMGNSLILILLMAAVMVAFLIWLSIKIVDRYFDCGGPRAFGMLFLGYLSLVGAIPLTYAGLWISLTEEEQSIVARLLEYSSAREEGGSVDPGHLALYQELNRLQSRELEDLVEIGDYTGLSLRQRIELRKLFEKRREDLKTRAREAKSEDNPAAKQELRLQAREFKEQFTAYREAMKAYSEGGMQ
jgi:hypothetical protein